jgi:hypothetical protein
MLDAMWSYGYEEAVCVGRAIEALNYCWYEAALAEEDVYNHVKLRQKLDIPILATDLIGLGDEPQCKPLDTTWKVMAKNTRMGEDEQQGWEKER